MKNLLYAISVIIIIGWAIGVIGYNVGGLIHVLLFVAMIAILLGVIQGKNRT